MYLGGSLPGISCACSGNLNTCDFRSCVYFIFCMAYIVWLIMAIKP